MIKESDTIPVKLQPEIIKKCIETAKVLLENIEDRANLHKRDYLERFINVLMGELSEQMVIQWLKENGKRAESSVDKTSGKPDLGHDVRVKLSEGGREAFCSVKSSLSYSRPLETLIKEFTIATQKSELRDINIQVYFWLTLKANSGKNRVTVPSLNQTAIICWFKKEDLREFTEYKNEKGRTAPDHKLINGRPMKKLLAELI